MVQNLSSPVACGRHPPLKGAAQGAAEASGTSPASQQSAAGSPVTTGGKIIYLALSTMRSISSISSWEQMPTSTHCWYTGCMASRKAFISSSVGT